MALYFSKKLQVITVKATQCCPVEVDADKFTTESVTEAVTILKAFLTIVIVTGIMFTL